ncbi:MAG: AbrB/MazE/SpoVT family DNA-binding domain-containing protein [Actinobacteria bacterium]|nr:AbrB/MazE/SpoVT family DNA-binding domain-containing protein [Actinomycetota bacterium]
MRTKVQRWGNSLAVRIPKIFAEEVGLADDTAIELRLIKGGLVIEPTETYAPTLAELLDGVTDENRHEEISWGEPVGDELW